MNSKMTTNSQLSTTQPKTNKKQKQTKQTTRTGTESQKQRSHGELPVGRRWVENGVKGTGNKKHKWQVHSFVSGFHLDTSFCISKLINSGRIPEVEQHKTYMKQNKNIKPTKHE